MSYQLTVLYHLPDDPAAFDAHYESTHAPLAAAIPGLRGYTVSRPAAGPDDAAPEEHLVACLVFQDRAGFLEGMRSDQGSAAADDIATFATGGVTMLTGEVTTYL